MEHGSSMQSIWEHEMPGDICPCKELAEAAWAAHERRQPSQKESKKRNREGDTGKQVPQDVGNADEKDENETTDRLERMSSACDKCANRCRRTDDEEREGGVCCQCMGKEDNCTGIQECKHCWQANTWKSKVRWSGRGPDKTGSYTPLSSKGHQTGVPKQKWEGTREKVMRVMLDKHETILNSYQT